MSLMHLAGLSRWQVKNKALDFVILVKERNVHKWTTFRCHVLPFSVGKLNFEETIFSCILPVFVPEVAQLFHRTDAATINNPAARFPVTSLISVHCSNSSCFRHVVTFLHQFHKQLWQVQEWEAPNIHYWGPLEGGTSLQLSSRGQEGFKEWARSPHGLWHSKTKRASTPEVFPCPRQTPAFPFLTIIPAISSNWNNIPLAFASSGRGLQLFLFSPHGFQVTSACVTMRAVSIVQGKGDEVCTPRSPPYNYTDRVSTAFWGMCSNPTVWM